MLIILLKPPKINEIQLCTLNTLFPMSICPSQDTHFVLQCSLVRGKAPKTPDIIKVIWKLTRFAITSAFFHMTCHRKLYNYSYNFFFKQLYAFQKLYDFWLILIWQGIKSYMTFFKNKKPTSMHIFRQRPVGIVT